MPEAFEKSLQYIEALALPKLDDADVQRDFFLLIWKTIVSVWGNGVFNDSCKLTEKVGIICMTRYVVDRLAALADMEQVDLDLSDLDDVAKAVTKLLRRQTFDFWNSKWKGSGYDTALGHSKVLEALVRISRNLKAGKEWETDIDIM